MKLLSLLIFFSLIISHAIAGPEPHWKKTIREVATGEHKNHILLTAVAFTEHSTYYLSVPTPIGNILEERPRDEVLAFLKELRKQLPGNPLIARWIEIIEKEMKRSERSGFSEDKDGNREPFYDYYISLADLKQIQEKPKKRISTRRTYKR